MGRGSSKAGGSIGSSTAGLPPVTQVLTPPTPAQIASGNVLPQGGVAFSKFEQMTDDEKADVIENALQSGVPAFLEDPLTSIFDNTDTISLWP